MAAPRKRAALGSSPLSAEQAAPAADSPLFDGGPAYQSDAGDGDQAAAEPGVVAPALLDDLEATPEQVQHLLAGLWKTARVVTLVTAGGPPDVFQPSDSELRGQARPLTGIINRHAQLAQLAQHGDYIGAAIELGGYAVGEMARVGQHRAAQAIEDGDPVPAAEQSPLDATPPPRPWSPQHVPPPPPDPVQPA